jgi:hypothetical protein
MTPIDTDQIIEEIHRKEQVRQWMYEVLASKSNYRDIQETKNGIDLVSSYIAGLEYSLNLVKEADI